MLEYRTADGSPIQGRIGTDDLGYVMIDDGPDYPYGAFVRQPTLGTALPDSPVVVPPTDKELLSELYQRNKYKFWIGGGTVGLLALSGLVGIIRHEDDVYIAAVAVHSIRHLRVLWRSDCWLADTATRSSVSCTQLAFVLWQVSYTI